MLLLMKHKLYYLLFLVLVSLDQITKQIFMSSYDLGQSVAVNSYLSWTYLQNTGAAFSIMADGGFIEKTFLLSVSVLVSIWLVFWNSKNLISSSSKIIRSVFIAFWRCWKPNRQSSVRLCC